LEIYSNYTTNIVTFFRGAGIQPHVTLHNYDLPQVLEDEYGGWVSGNIMYASDLLYLNAIQINS